MTSADPTEAEQRVAKDATHRDRLRSGVTSLRICSPWTRASDVYLVVKRPVSTPDRRTA